MSNHSALDVPHTTGWNLNESEPFLRGLVESGILLLLAVGVERLFFGTGYYATLVQHPFWIVVLLAAVQHGLFVGVATAGLATLMMDWPVRPVGADITAHYVEVAILPLQWLLAALCIGVFRQGEMRKDADLRSEARALREMNEALAGEVRRIDTVLEHTELAAVTQSGSLDMTPSLLEGFLALHNASRDELQERFQSVARLCSPLQSELVMADEQRDFGETADVVSIADFPQFAKAKAHSGTSLRNTVATLDTSRHLASDPPDRFLVVSAIPPLSGHTSPGAVCFVAEREVDAVTTRAVAELLAAIISSALARIETGHPQHLGPVTGFTQLSATTGIEVRGD